MDRGRGNAGSQTVTRPARKRVLVLSTLWPNPTAPRFGTFVESSIRALAKHSEWEPVVVNPLGLPPVRLGRYRALADHADTADIDDGLHVERPGFTLLPRIGGRFNPAQIATSVLPIARREHEAAPFACVDAQFFYPDGPAAARVAKALGVPLSIKARGADIHYWGSKPYAREMMLGAGEHAAGLLAVSEAMADSMARLGMARGKIAVHYTGLDRDRFRPHAHDGLRLKLSEELGIPLETNEPLLVTTGALIERKGQAFVIEALAQLPDARLLLIGRGPNEAKLRGLAQTTGVADRVHFLGSVDHDLLPLALSAADAMVLPSASEGLANAWVEALACGTPVVTTDVGGARELIRDPSAGVLVERSVEAVAQGIREVLANRADRQTVAANVEAFSWKANGQALAAHYDAISGY